MAFVIRTFPRCGTHMVRTALEAHPELIVGNEIFNPDVSGFEKIEKLGAFGLYHANTGPNQGFVAHGYTDMEKFDCWQATQDLWTIMEQQRPIVIALSRRDLLRRAFSIYQARTTQRWHVWKSQQARQPLGQPKVQAHEVEWQLTTAWKSFEETKRRFPWAVHFTYEDLVDNWNDEMARMQRALGVSVIDLTPATDKQDQRPIHQMVSNYHELKRVFKGTVFEKWFTLAEQNDERRAV